MAVSCCTVGLAAPAADLDVVRDEIAGVDRYASSWTYPMATLMEDVLEEAGLPPEAAPWSLEATLDAVRHLCWDLADHERRAIDLEVRGVATWLDDDTVYDIRLGFEERVGGTQQTVLEYLVDGVVVARYTNETPEVQENVTLLDGRVIAVLSVYVVGAFAELVAEWLHIDDYCLRLETDPASARLEVGTEATFVATLRDWREEAVEDATVSVGPGRRGSVEPSEQQTTAEGTATVVYGARREGLDSLSTRASYSFYTTRKIPPQVEVEPWQRWFLWAELRGESFLYLTVVEKRGRFDGPWMTLAQSTRGMSLYVNCIDGGRSMITTDVLDFSIDEPPTSQEPPWDLTLVDRYLDVPGSARFESSQEGAHPAGSLYVTIPVAHGGAVHHAEGRIEPQASTTWRRVLGDIQRFGPLMLEGTCRAAGY